MLPPNESGETLGKILVECHLHYPTLSKKMLQNKYNEGQTLNFLNTCRFAFGV